MSRRIAAGRPRRPNFRRPLRLAGALVVASIAGSTSTELFAQEVGSDPTTAAAPTTAPLSLRRVTHAIEIDGRAVGRRFDGVGAVSAGASTRLLFDYPEPQRGEILDYLFRPNFGMNLTFLKVEIGGDMDSTDGAEASHMRSRDDLNGDRGYEWWLMREARKRNPDIAIGCLGWGAPGWIAGGYWSQDNLEYTLKWLDLAEKNGIRIDYAGGWNESGFDKPWLIQLAARLKQSHPGVKIIAADDTPTYLWRVAKAMRHDPAFDAAVDVIGQHSPGGWRSNYENYVASDEALWTKRPIWASEQSSLGRHVGAVPWARGLNRAFIDAAITNSTCWPPVCAWYANLPIADTGPISAEWPWSGYYEVGCTAWAFAHTAQFAAPGWHYLDGACAMLDSGASYVTLKSPTTDDYSTIIETVDLREAAEVTIRAAGVSEKPLNVWVSDVASKDPAKCFVRQPAIERKDGAFTLRLEPGRIYSLTTTTGQCKGDAKSTASAFDEMQLPFAEDFEGYGAGKLARYFSDTNGGFETVPAAGGRKGMAYRQMVPQPPLTWHSAAQATTPMTIFGDPRWWGDYELSSDVYLEVPGFVELVGRISAQRKRTAGYHLRVDDAGRWELRSEGLPALEGDVVTLASGTSKVALREWHRVALRMRGARIDVVIDGTVVGGADDARHTTGNAALAVGAWQPAQFDNVKVVPTAPAPTFVDGARVTAIASSEHAGNAAGYDYAAANAVDGRPETAWSTEWEPPAPLPQSITLDLGANTSVDGLTYAPQLKGETRGIVTRYAVSLSADGKAFRKVSEGEWPLGTATRFATWPSEAARYVRLDALASGGDRAAASEIRIATSPLVAPNIK